MQDCRKTWETTRDPQAALDKLNRRKCPERALLSGLLKHAPKNDFCGALNWIARTTRLMYVHAYQSYIWNVTVSMKVAKHGLTPQIGDLVATRTGADKILTR
jgi:tRNA pseudouridine13 synthase